MLMLNNFVWRVGHVIIDREWAELYRDDDISWDLIWKFRSSSWWQSDWSTAGWQLNCIINSTMVWTLFYIYFHRNCKSENYRSLNNRFEDDIPIIIFKLSVYSNWQPFFTCSCVIHTYWNYCKLPSSYLKWPFSLKAFLLF